MGSQERTERKKRTASTQRHRERRLGSRIWFILGVGGVLLGCDSPPTMTVASTPHASTIEPESTTAPVRSRGCGPADRAFPTVLTGAEILVTFDKPLSGRAINQYWIALVPEYAPESDTSGRTFLDRGTTTVRLRASAPGDYEVRLHGEYPKNEHHLLARTPVKVQGWPVKIAVDAAPPTGEQTGRR